MDERRRDLELKQVIDELIGLVQEAKQAAWQSAPPAVHAALDDLRAYLADRLVAVAEADEAIVGITDPITTPTGRKLRNLRSEAGDVPGGVVALLVDDLRSVADDIRARGAAIGEDEAGMLAELANGLDEHTDRIAVG